MNGNNAPKETPKPIAPKTPTKPAARAAHLKAAPKAAKRPAKKKESPAIYILASVIALVLIALILYLVRPQLFSGLGSAPPKTEDPLAATVNGQPIYAKDVARQLENLPPPMRAQADPVTILNQLIDERLLLDEAKQQGIAVGPGEMSAELEKLLNDSQMSRADLDTLIASRNFTSAEFEDLFMRRLIITKLVNRTILPSVNVSAEQARAFYDANPARFARPESVEASHILVAAEEDAKALLGRLEKDEDFAQLAVDYSIDPSVNDSNQSGVSLPGNKGNLGAFSRGYMVPAFDEAAFALDVGEISDPVQTPFGWHLIKVTAKHPAEPIPFDDVEAQIIQDMRLERSQRAFEDHLAALRKSATIKIYPAFSDRLGPNASAPGTAPTAPAAPAALQIEATAYPQAGYTDVAIQDGAVMQQLRVPSADRDDVIEYLAQELGLAAADIASATTFEEAAEAKPTEAPAPPPQSLAVCLRAKGAMLYGAYWNKATQDQLALFGAHKDQIRYTECGVPGDFKAQTAACDAAGIEAYPTWKIAESLELGNLDEATLKTLSGC